MGFVSREIEKIRKEIVKELEKNDTEGRTTSSLYEKLAIANQALGWALEPNGVMSPYTYIMNVNSHGEDYKEPEKEE